MTDHDFHAEARQYADRIPDPPAPPANVIRFQTRSERWLREHTRPMLERHEPHFDGPEAA